MGLSLCPINDAALLSRLASIAKQARIETRALAHEVYSNVGETVNPREFQQTSETSAFLAFVALGGDRDRWERFEWLARADELLDATIANIEDDLAGPDSQYWDYRARFRRRNERAVLKTFRWSQWDSAGGVAPDEGFGTRSVNGIVFDWCDHATQQEQDYRMIELEALENALADVLTPYETYLMIEHYMYDRQYKDLAAELVSQTPELQEDPNGHYKAMNRIASTLHRARERAADRLDDHWSKLLQDAA